MSENGGPAPGWYPQSDGSQRWWDGSTWTDHLRPSPTATAVQTAVPVQAAQRQHLGAWLALLGGAAFVLGLVLGFLPVASNDVHCGSAFRADTTSQNAADLGAAIRADAGLNPDYSINDLPSKGCDAALASQRTPALILTVLGGAVALGGVVELRRRP